MSEQDAPEALAEYVVYKEKPDEVKLSWLKNQLNGALRKLPYCENSLKQWFVGSAYHNMAWTKLLGEDAVKIIDEESGNHRFAEAEGQVLNLPVKMNGDEAPPDLLIEDLEQYVLRTETLLVKEHILATVTLCITKANDPYKAFVDLLNGLVKGLQAENMTSAFLLNLSKKRSRKFFIETLKSSITNDNLIREHHKLITAYREIFPATKELEEIHERKMGLLELFSQCNETWLKGGGEASDWFKTHPTFLKELKKNNRDLMKLYVTKKVDRNKFVMQTPCGQPSEKKKFVANFIWNNIFGKDRECPKDLLCF